MRRKRLLPDRAEEVGDLAMTLLDEHIGIDELVPEPFGEQPTDGGLAGAHEASEHDVAGVEAVMELRTRLGAVRIGARFGGSVDVVRSSRSVRGTSRLAVSAGVVSRKELSHASGGVGREAKEEFRLDELELDDVQLATCGLDEIDSCVQRCRLNGLDGTSAAAASPSPTSTSSTLPPNSA